MESDPRENKISKTLYQRNVGTLLMAIEQTTIFDDGRGIWLCRLFGHGEIEFDFANKNWRGRNPKSGEKAPPAAGRLWRSPMGVDKSDLYHFFT